VTRWKALTLLAAICLPPNAVAQAEVDGIEPQRADHVHFLARDLILDFARDDDGEHEPFRAWVLGGGWSRAEAKGSWGMGRSAELQASLAPEVDHLWIEGAAYRGLDGPLEVEVRLDGKPVGRFEPDRKRRWYDFELPRRGEDRRPVDIELRFSRSRSPQSAGLGTDSRALALFVNQMVFAAGTRRPDSSEKLPPVVETPTGLSVNRAGRVLYNLDIEARYSSVDVTMHLDQSCGENAHLSVWQPATGRKIAERQFTRADQERDFVRLAIDPKIESLQVAVDVAGPVKDLTVRAQPVPPKKRQVEINDGTNTTGRRPDIFVFVLDASRADHFGQPYGYERDTVPIISNMAEESLVFPVSSHRPPTPRAPSRPCSPASGFQPTRSSPRRTA